jgi:hypothetical protein
MCRAPRTMAHERNDRVQFIQSTYHLTLSFKPSRVSYRGLAALAFVLKIPNLTLDVQVSALNDISEHRCIHLT